MKLFLGGVGANRVEELAGSRVEADNLATGAGRESERYPVLHPVRPIRAKVADELERSHDDLAVVFAVVAFHARQVLVRL